MMAPLTEAENQKKLRIYHWWTRAGILYGILLGIVLPCIIALFPKDRTLHNLVGFTFLGLSFPFLIATVWVLTFKITQRVEIAHYLLPHKLGKDKSIYYFFGGIALGFTLLMMPVALGGKPIPIVHQGSPTGASLPGWAPLPVIWGLFGLMLLFTTWRGVILCQDHLIQYQGWKKRRLFFREINRVEVLNQNSHRVMEIHHAGADKSPLLVELSYIPAKDYVFMLNVVHHSAPHVVMNELAQQIRQGEVPVF
ncbi:MAG: hypothetical protein ACAI44_40750 [Candidatus Sericytochromatia bacterium]